MLLSAKIQIHRVLLAEKHLSPKHASDQSILFIINGITYN